MMRDCFSVRIWDWGEHYTALIEIRTPHFSIPALCFYNMRSLCGWFVRGGVWLVSAHAFAVGNKAFTYLESLSALL